MSLKKSEQIGANQYCVTFDASRESFDAAITKVYKKAVRNISIPGFRKGKAPRSIVEKMYGKEVFYEDAVNEILPAAYEEAMKDFEGTVVSRPEFEIETIDENGVVITAKFFVKPEVEIEGYKGIPVTRTVPEVTDANVDEELEKIRNRNSRVIDITDRPSAMGDVVNFDYEGSVDGVPFEGGRAEGQDLKLGSGQFIPGFEDQLAGHSIGDEFDVNVTFPEEYHASELAGKAAVFKCKMNGIKFNELPVLDDEFARDVSEFDTLDEYKNDIKAKIAERNEKAADADVEEQLIAALIEKLNADIPEAMFENETENFVRDYDSRLRMQGLDLSTYLKYTGLTLDKIREQMRPDAERQVKTRLALEKIAVLENIEISDEETEEEYKRLAEAYGMEADKVKAAVAVDALKEDIKVKKAVDLVKESAAVTEGKAEADGEEKPKAKRAPAKKKAADAEDGEAKPAAKKTTAKSTASKTTAKKTAKASQTEEKAEDKAE
ncbi:MAG: trigger factor [Clostridiales bacterium]|nr:trigger factor [Clostridiales bacterium]